MAVRLKTDDRQVEKYKSLREDMWRFSLYINDSSWIYYVYCQQRESIMTTFIARFTTTAVNIKGRGRL